jgi:flagellar FliJ protein
MDRLRRMQRLLRLREHIETMARNLLALELAEEEARKQAVDEQRVLIDQQQSAMSRSLGLGMKGADLVMALSYLDARQRGLARSLNRLAEQLPVREKARQELEDKRRERRILERLQERLSKLLEQEENRREQKVLDELGLREVLARNQHVTSEVN